MSGQGKISGRADDLPPIVTDASAWYGPDIERRSEWIHPLADQDIAEIEAAMKPLAGRKADIALMTRTDFPLPTLAPKLESIRDEVVKGRGFALMRGLPVGRWSIRESATAYFGIGTHFGNVRSQNAMGHILGHVRDLGRDAVNDPTARVYQTNERQTYHADRSDIVALLCLKTAKSGGASSLVSSMTIYNEMYRRAPDLLKILFEPFPMDRRGEEAPGQKPYTMTPVFTWHKGYLSGYYVRRYIESASRFADAPPLTARQIEALDMFDSIANDPDTHLHMDFQPGDMQWVYNHTLLHDRTAFVDWPEEERKRHLLRLWLAVPGDRPLADVYADRWGSVEIGARGGVEPRGDLIAPLRAA